MDFTYDSNGRLYQQSHPYCGSGDPNNVSDRYGYDGLNRAVVVSYPDSQAEETYYGLDIGNLNGATAQQGSASTYGYGYPQVSSDESSHEKEQWLDGFGRVVEVDEPNLSAPPAGTVQISGSEQSIWSPYGSTYDSGVVQVTINSSTYTAYYGEYDDDSSVASQIASAISHDSSAPVTAAQSGGSIVLTGKGAGPYSLGYSSNTSDPSDFYTPSFYGGGPSSLSNIVDSLTNSPVVTNYLYDAGDRLTEVIQGVQTRTFAYDGLGRKVSETTPEGGTVTYSYNVSGGGLCSGDPSSVCQRTDARGVISYYNYNSANQLTGVSYAIPGGQNIASMPNVCTSNGASANVCYYYGQGGSAAYALGRLTEITDPTGSESYSHDAIGRVTKVSKVIGSQTFNTSFQYNPGSEVTQITYPSGRVVKQNYFNAGTLCEIAASGTGCSDSSYYAGGFSYNGPGKLLGFTYGNGVGATFSYSANRTQLTSLAYTKGSSTNFNLNYWYQQNSSYCPNGTGGNNGSVQCITDVSAPGRSASYSYDLLGRMISATTAGSTAYPQWGMAETYDRFGNRWDQTATAGSVPQPQLTFGTGGINGSTTNRPNGYTYDASGNMTVEPVSGSNYMTYDGENRMTAFSGSGGAASYSYDGNGLRVVKSVSGGTTTVSIFSGSSVIAEYDNGAAPSAPSREYIYNGAAGDATGLLAMISGGATTYYHQDHLSVRLTTDGSGNILTQEGHFPFGEQWYQSGSGNKWVFTSYQRDSESGLDYALARYYDSRTGTFCSADPLAGSPDDPQSWNRYPYGRTDPIGNVDPSGKSFGSFLESLISDLFMALGGPLGIAFVREYDATEGSAPPMLPGISGGIPVGSSWSGTPIYIPNRGIAGALGLPTMADVGGPIMNVGKEDDIMTAALQAPNLADCAHSFFGPKFSFTRSNLPHIYATDLDNGASGRTEQAMVPATGRATVLIDNSFFAMKANDPMQVDNYLHEAANATAIQQFTNQQTAAVFVHPTRQLRAELGPRGSRPSNAQHNQWDPDIGQQFENCLHGQAYR